MFGAFGEDKDLLADKLNRRRRSVVGRSDGLIPVEDLKKIVTDQLKAAGSPFDPDQVSNLCDKYDSGDGLVDV